MGFRNPLTSLSADQITPGTLAPGVIGRTLATATEGRRVVISTPEGDAGRVDFWSDPAQPQMLPGHALVAAQPIAGVPARGTLTLELDELAGAALRLTSSELSLGGRSSQIDLDADRLTDGEHPITRTVGVVTLGADLTTSGEVTALTDTCRIRDGRVRLTLTGAFQGSVAGDLATVRVRRNPGQVIIAEFTVRIVAVGGPGRQWHTLTTAKTWIPDLDFGVDADTQIYATLARTNGTGTISLIAGAQLIVEDGAAK